MKTRGSVLVLALWTLLVLGFLAVAVGGYVSANLQVANHLKYQTRAAFLARAGVNLAIAEVMQHASNYNGTAVEDLGEDEELFKDNDSLEGGLFSVRYTFDNTNDATIVTNFGLLSEHAKIDIDADMKSTRRRLESLVGASAAGNILSNYPAEKDVAQHERTRYGAYDTLPELLAVPGVDDEAFARLEGLVTVRQYKRFYTAPNKPQTARQSYGATVEGRAIGGGRVMASRRIVFVFDRVTTNLLYWREY